MNRNILWLNGRLSVHPLRRKIGNRGVLTFPLASDARDPFVLSVEGVQVLGVVVEEQGDEDPRRGAADVGEIGDPAHLAEMADGAEAIPDLECDPAADHYERGEEDNETKHQDAHPVVREPDDIGPHDPGDRGQVLLPQSGFDLRGCTESISRNLKGLHRIPLR